MIFKKLFIIVWERWFKPLGIAKCKKYVTQKNVQAVTQIDLNNTSKLDCETDNVINVIDWFKVTFKMKFSNSWFLDE